MQLQIGVSKAIRNVISNSLSDLFQEVFVEAKRGFVDAIAKRINEGGRDAALQSIFDMAATHQTTPDRLVAYIGRKAEKWTIQDITKLISTLNAIGDGLINADDVFPESLNDAKEEKAEAKAATVEELVQKRTAAKVEKPKQEAAQAAKAEAVELPAEESQPEETASHEEFVAKDKYASAGDAVADKNKLIAILADAFPSDKQEIFERAKGRQLIAALERFNINSAVQALKEAAGIE
jgi:hypothetical protein